MKEVHVTDLNSFASCPRRWDFESMLRRGLQRAVIPEPLFMGQAVHVALNIYYSEGRDLDAATTGFKAWMLERAENIRQRTGPLWEHERQMINECHALGVRMLDHYDLWSAKRDENYEFIELEQRFSVPIPIPPEVRAGVSHRARRRLGWMRQGLEWYDGNMMFAGRFDGVVRDKRNDKLYLLEFKTSRSLKNTSWIYRGLQGTAYVYAARQMFGDIAGIMYRVLLKRAPEAPQPLKRPGMFSQRQKQKTTFEYFKRWLDHHAEANELDVRALYLENEKVLRELHNRRRSDGSNDFFEERIIRKYDAMQANAIRTIYYTGLRMTDPNVPIYAKPTWFGCNQCPFQDICDMMEMGMHEEANAVLDAEFAPRSYWETPKDS